MFQFIGVVINTCLRWIFIAAGLALAFLLTASGLVFALCLLAWQRLRGRPARPFNWMKNGAPMGRAGGFRFRREGPRSDDEVVDVEVREISEASEPTFRDDSRIRSLQASDQAPQR